MASAIGTSTVCAQYRTTTTSTHPANVTHRLSVFDVSSTRPYCVCRRRGRMIPRGANSPSASNPASVEESAAADQQHDEDDDEQSGCVHFLSRVFCERGPAA